MKLLDLLNVIEDDTPIWIYIDHPFPCKKEGLFFGAVQFAAENDSEWESGMEAREGDVGGSGHRRNACDRA